jgi:hypothetical protein
MDERTTFSSMGERYSKGEIAQHEFISYFEAFKSGLLNLRDEFKNKIEPAIYFNPDNKKLAEKSAMFMAIYDDYEKGIEAIEKALMENKKELFQKGYTAILASTEKLNSLKSEIADIMKTMTPI